MRAKAVSTILLFLWFLWPVLVASTIILATGFQPVLVMQGYWEVDPMENAIWVDPRMMAATLLNCVWFVPAIHFCPFRVFKGLDTLKR